MKKFSLIIATMFLCTFCLQAVATTIDLDPSALIGGSATFEVATEWLARVDYAVYEPGNYPGGHPDAAVNYIYAYQIVNDVASSATLASFSLDLDLGAGAANPDYDDYGLLGGDVPLLSRLLGVPPTSVNWIVDLDPGEHSQVLLFSSPYSYTYKSATLVNAGQGDTHQLPSPIPDPATICLLGLGGLALIRRPKRS